MRTSIVFALAAATAVSAQTYGQQNCDDVYNKCIQEYTSKGQAPFFPECNSRRAACAGTIVQPSQSSTTAPPAYATTTTTTSAYATSTTYSGKCQDVYDQCIASYTSQGQSPFFPECNSRRAACQAGSSYSTGPVPTFPPPPTTTSSVSVYPTTTSYSDKCQDVYNQCIQSYTSKGQAPFFPECNSRRAACQGGSYSTSSVYTTTTVSKPAITTTSASNTTSVSIPAYKPTTTTTGRVGTYTGGAATQAPFFGLMVAAGALALM